MTTLFRQADILIGRQAMSVVHITPFFTSIFHFGAEKLNLMLIGADFVKKLIFEMKLISQSSWTHLVRFDLRTCLCVIIQTIAWCLTSGD